MTSVPSESKPNKPSIQFPCSSSDLPSRLAEEISRSPYKSRPKYLNALLELVLGIPKNDAVSCLQTLVEWIQLFQALPIERIRKLAPTQNRNFQQMFKHLLEIALTYYPEEPSQDSVIREVQLTNARSALHSKRSLNSWPQGMADSDIPRTINN